MIPTCFSVEMIGHRGDQTHALENTKEAFVAAWKDKALGAECDVMLSKDKEIIIFHDQDLNRLTGQKDKRSINQVSFLDLAKIELKDPQRFDIKGNIPSLKEILSIIPSGKKLFVELKADNDGVEEELIAKIPKAISGFEDKIVLISFDLSALAKLRPMLPKVVLMGITANNDSGESWLQVRKDVGMKEIIALAKKGNLNGIYLELMPKREQIGGPSYDVETLKALKKNGLLTGIWSYAQDDTVESFKQLEKGWSYLDFYNTNFPNLKYK